MIIDDVEYIKKSDVRTECEPDETDGLKYAIVRSRQQGVMSGYVLSIEGQSVTLKRARQIWRYDSKFVLVDMAEYGVRNQDECKFSCESSQGVVMLEACGVLYCTKEARSSIRSVEAQNND